ncbi:hypothetical protein BDZ91DRAFT_762967 [Kalaharituber pfeilii]|nr:hypothetical protein BDZ91DRAFT_762967 [Kalaharituber pfeilii]
MPPTVMPSSSSHLLPHHHLSHISSRERRELNAQPSSNTLLYSAPHLSSSGTQHSSASAGSNLKRQRSPTLDSPTTDSKTTAADRYASSSAKVPPTPVKKPISLQKKPAVPTLSLKTTRKSISSTATRPPTAVPQTPTLTSPTSARPPTSLLLASPTSPVLKRKSPARFSSNGISTTAGPPPSLAYRRANMDQLAYPSTPKTTRNNGNSSTVTARGGAGPQQTEVNSKRMDIDEEADQDRTIRGLEDIPRQSENRKNSKREDEDEDTAMTDVDSSKDLFLSLAKADPPRIGLHTKTRFEERRSRIAERSSVPAEARPVSHSDASEVSPMSYPNPKSVSVPMVDTLAEALEKGPRDASTRPLSSLKRESYNDIDRVSSPERAGSSYRYGSLNLSASPLQQERTIASMLEQDKANKPNGSVAGDTASTVSTNAASVWDELDDLKSRIRKLELTGNAAGFGKGSDSSGGRPRTATTTATTMSSSPKHHNTSGQIETPPESTTGHTAHPLLHTALSKAQNQVPTEVYKSLESTVKDAFGLVDLVGSNGTSGATATPPAPGIITDRQVRRKVDSLCRSLTELCIALSEARTTIAHSSHIQPPGSSMSHSHLLSSLRPMTREGGIESRRDLLEERLRSGRESVLSDRKFLNRFTDANARRPSMQSLAPPALPLPNLQQSASFGDIDRKPSTASEMPATKLARASMLLKARREQAGLTGRTTAENMMRDGEIDHIMQDLDMQESYRTPSRATDFFRARRRLEERSNQEREREIEQITQELRRPSIFNRSSSSATVTQSTIATQRGSPLGNLRNSEVEDGVTGSPRAGMTALERMARRAQLTRSMQEPAITPLSPVESTRRFFDDRERSNRNTIHTERLETYGNPSRLTALELKRLSHSGTTGGSSARNIRNSVDFDDLDYGMERNIGTRDGETRRFLRRRVD